MLSLPLQFLELICFAFDSIGKFADFLLIVGYFLLVFDQLLLGCRIFTL